MEYTFAGLFTAADFTKTLNIDKHKETTLINILTQYQRRLILISCGNHTISIFKSEEQISLYNSNHKSGRVFYACKNIDLLVCAIFKAYKFNEKEYSPIGFRIFTFDQDAGVYPKQEKILSQFNNPLTSKAKTRLVDYSALHIATRIGSKACVKYYLGQSAELDLIMTKKRTPLHIAATRNYKSIATLLINKNADINKRCRGTSSPLTGASKAGHLKIVKLMLEHKPNASFKNLLTALNCLATSELRDKLLKSLNEKTLKTMMNNRVQIEAQLLQYKYSKNFDINLQNELIQLLNIHNTPKKNETSYNGLGFFILRNSATLSVMDCENEKASPSMLHPKYSVY